MLETPKCWIRKCRHFVGVKQDNEDEETERIVCKAFPDGIPEKIAYGTNQHEKPLPDQENDIVYEKN